MLIAIGRYTSTNSLPLSNSPHSVGPNYFQLPCNKPINTVYAPYVRDGPGTINGNYGGDPDYVGSRLNPVSVSKRVQVPTHENWSRNVTAFATSISDKDFEQPRKLWQIICGEPKGREQFLHNILPTLQDIPDEMKEQVLGKLRNAWGWNTPLTRYQNISDVWMRN
jgi:catalase